MSWKTNKSSGNKFKTTRTPKIKKTGSTKATTGKTIKSPKKPVLGKDYHIYRVFAYSSDEGGGDSHEIAHIKAKNMDDAVEFAKKKFIKEEFHKDIEENGDDMNVDLSLSYAVDEDTGEEMTDDQREKMQDEGKEMDIDWRTEGWNIVEDDEEKENFETIYGGNDFFDITESVDKPKTRGMSSEEAVKFHGGLAPSLFFGMNRINQKVNEDAIREKYRKIIDAINDQPIPQKARRVLTSELEAKMKDEIRGIGRVPTGEITAEGEAKPAKDYGSGYGVK